jgi:hypothetical protein
LVLGHTSVIITTNVAFEWPSVFGDANSSDEFKAELER